MKPKSTQDAPADIGNTDSPVSSGVTSAPAGVTDARPAPATLDFALLRGALEEVPFGVATTRGDALLYANEALTRLFGAPSGGLEHKRVSDLFTPAAFEEISKSLADTRVFDGRVRARAFDGREMEVDVHLEWYSSEAQGTGGFVIVRDISLEVGALGRLVEQLAGALFRVRVDTHTIEMVSPSIARIIGIDVAKCVQRPVLLTTLLSSEERERIAFLYRRMARGELLVANAQVSVRRPDGTTRVVQIRGSARRDTSGVVRHIDGIVIDAARDPEGARGLADARPNEGASARADDVTARATMDLTHELLREGSQHINAVVRETRALRSALKSSIHALPHDLAAELAGRVEALAHAVAGVGSVNRAARHALARPSMGAPLGEVLDAVRTTLAPMIGDRAVTVDAGDAAGVVIADHVDGVTLALTHLALRAFRFAGSGTVHLYARHASPPEPPSNRRLPPKEQVVVEIIGAAPADLAEAAMEISSEMLRTVPRPDEADLAHNAAQALIGAAGGTLESDDATFTTARSVIRFRIP